VVDKVDVEIDEKVFQYRSLASKKPQIVCATKNPEILLPVYHMIRSRAAAGLNCGKQFEWIFLEQQTEVETATILGDSLLFLFFSVAEGLGRMPLEAMACGCISVAFSYGPLKCMVPQHEFEYADIVGLVQFVEKVMESYPRELEQWDLRISAGREIARRYSMKNQEVTVLKAWSRIYRHETI
jgi:glycosyltransferase involved in cell wall biosynthesis